ncbi:MAG: hypothetical protein R3190_19210, partial [Thermoanaerobaculia bacterium]|nr:hypothetical protein [Thermoanaerobaculia bacterium]
MRLDAGSSLRLAATDLAKHLSCRHLTQLDLAAARGELERPQWHDPRAEALRERGFEHERAYVEQLRDAGREVLELDDPDGELPEDERLARTREAM